MKFERLFKALEQARGQRIVEDTFQLEEDVCRRINNINMSSEVSYIIKEVGRLCDSYASDAFYDLSQLFEDLTGDKSVLFEKDTYQWVIGIRDMGCDSASFLDSALSQGWDIEKRYRAIYEIHIEPDDRYKSHCWYRMTLSKISLWSLEYEYKKLKEVS